MISSEIYNTPLSEREIAFERNTFRNIIEYLNSTGMDAHFIDGELVYCKGTSMIRIKGREGEQGKLHLSGIIDKAEDEGLI